MSETSKTLSLVKELISRPSVTPQDKGCQQLLIDTLEPHGFKADKLDFAEVENLWLRRGNEAPLFCFAGHTDVVPTGPLESWKFDPFTATEADGKLYGRGSADMKGGIAAFTAACERFVRDHPDHKGSIALLITSDEEGPAKNGTVKVVETLQARNEKIDWCLVGEPSSTQQTGDVIKNGRRGALGCKLKIISKQGHVAYPQLANNPIHLAAPFLAELTAIEWDNGNQFFPPTSLQVANINAGTGASNVIPGTLEMDFNLRFSTEITPDEIKQKVQKLIEKHQFDYEIEWILTGMPFLTSEGDLVKATVAAIKEVTGIDTELSTSGGTSDGRFIAPTGAQVIELGPTNASIHQINECVGIEELDILEKIYYGILAGLLL